MKLGISLVGVSYDLGRNYSHCAPHIFDKLINPFKASHSVSIYLTSYSSAEQDNIISTYSPKLYNFLDLNNSHQVSTYIASLEQLKNEDLDFVISTRFDIHFNHSLSTIGLKYDKFNALFREKGWWDNMHFTTDNLFAFPHFMVCDFIDVLKELYINPSRTGQTDLHQAFYRMSNKVGAANTNIVSDIDELSNTNYFYSLCNQKWGVRD